MVVVIVASNLMSSTRGHEAGKLGIFDETLLLFYFSKLFTNLPPAPAREGATLLILLFPCFLLFPYLFFPLSSLASNITLIFPFLYFFFSLLDLKPCSYLNITISL